MPTATRSVSRHRSYLIALAIAACVAGMGVLLAALDPPIGWFDRSAAPEPLGRWSLVWVLLFVAAIIASTVGFAFSAIAGAMVLHFVPNGIEAVQIMMFATIGLQTYSVLALRRSIEWSRCLPFLGGGIAAMPLGIVLLLALHNRAYVLLMGAALIGYGLYMQFRRPAALVCGEHRIADVAVGALGGITGPLAAFPGACLVVWCGMRGWDKIVQRAVYQPYILVLQIVALSVITLLRPGSIDLGLAAYALPGFAGAVIGMRVFHSLTDLHFYRTVHAALVASGFALVLEQAAA